MTVTNWIFEDKAIRSILRESPQGGIGEPWFVAQDVGTALSLSNIRQSLQALSDDEKDVSLTDTLGGQQNMQIINESGLSSDEKTTITLNDGRANGARLQNLVNESGLSSDEKNTITLSNTIISAGNPNLLAVSESGLFTLILRKPKALTGL